MPSHIKEQSPVIKDRQCIDQPLMFGAEKHGSSISQRFLPTRSDVYPRLRVKGVRERESRLS